MTEIVFWQSMISPHQAGLAQALADRPGLEVTYVATEAVRRSRAAMGWVEPSLGSAQLKLAETGTEIAELAQSFGPDAIHLCQGFRGNGTISHALPALARKGARMGVMMEAVDQRGKTGWLKKPLYRRQVKHFGGAVSFCLAISDEAGRFIAECGFRADRIYPFSYFLNPAPETAQRRKTARQIVYVGRLIALKRVDLLIEAFGALNLPDTTLSIIGSGPLRGELQALAHTQPNADAIEWLGTVSNEAAQQVIANSDCLVLPSEYDGWGAVVTEALLAGTPAICSSACGAKAAVPHSGAGGVFASGDKVSLERLIRLQLSDGPWAGSQRANLRNWAQNALSAEAGAVYLEAIIASIGQTTAVPAAPWITPHGAEIPQKIKTFVTR
ncbi:MAG: glycosyltransferase family 4 protein [Rhizobiales bacterium]|nr:glycosyltransferase family 4 protein [Hyphomicrobiales bacterium]